MPGLKITRDQGRIDVEFVDQSVIDSMGYIQGSWAQHRFAKLEHHIDDDNNNYCIVRISDANSWEVSHDGSVGLMVDTIDGVAIDTFQKLLDGLRSLMT